MRSNLDTPLPLADTLRSLEATPAFDPRGPAPSKDQWDALWFPIFQTASDEVSELIDYVKSITPYPILKNTQLTPETWVAPNLSYVAKFEICPDDAHLAKSRDITPTEQRLARNPNLCRGFTLTLELSRVMITPHRDLPAEIVANLAISPGPEMAAFRDIHRNWRGIIELLLKDVPIAATIMQSCASLPSRRNKTRIGVLDLALDPVHLDKEIYLQLESKWRVETPSSKITQSFQALAILFTCIQAATHQPRSEKRHLLDAWIRMQSAKSVE